MKLLVITYPELSAVDFELIQNFRRSNDPLYYHVVKPHFTLVFAVDDTSSKDFLYEIKKQLSGSKSIDFSIRYAAINKDAFSQLYHAFLVPEKGYSDIVKLHEKLYSNKLSKHQRLDIEYIPHIGVGNSTDKKICERMVDEWNKKDLEINGRISSVDIVNYDGKTVTTIEKINLPL